MITSEQIKGARGMLGWSAQELANKSGLGLATIQRMENRGTGKSTAENLQAVQSALNEAGIMFLEAGEHSAEGGKGIRFVND